MEKRDAIELLKDGQYERWNKYRQSHPKWEPDLMNSNVSMVNFRDNPFNMDHADFRGALLPSKRNWPLGRVSNQRRGVIGWLSSVDESAFVSTFDDAIYSKETKFNGSGDFTLLETLGFRLFVPRVFVSYTHKNNDKVHAIKQRLREMDIEITIDVENFYAGNSIRQEILNAMLEADVILIFYSTEARGRPWVDFERELARDLEMEAKIKKKAPPRIIYVVLDEITLPTVIEKSKIAIYVKGRLFKEACEEIYAQIMQTPRKNRDIDLGSWDNVVL